MAVLTYVIIVCQLLCYESLQSAVEWMFIFYIGLICKIYEATMQRPSDTVSACCTVC